MESNQKVIVETSEYKHQKESQPMSTNSVNSGTPQTKPPRKSINDLPGDPKDEPNWEELSQLIDLAHEAKNRSYSPYSKFRVGCVLKTADGKYYQGTNVENASYGLSICAERTAFVKAVSEGHRKFEKIVVAGDVEELFISPCGACRQFMSEFGNLDVYLTKPDKSFKKVNIYDLLPYTFTPDDLK